MRRCVWKTEEVKLDSVCMTNGCFFGLPLLQEPVTLVSCDLACFASLDGVRPPVAKRPIGPHDFSTFATQCHPLDPRRRHAQSRFSEATIVDQSICNNDLPKAEERGSPCSTRLACMKRLWPSRPWRKALDRRWTTVKRRSTMDLWLATGQGISK
jgi:hypothetical protein